MRIGLAALVFTFALSHFLAAEDADEFIFGFYSAEPQTDENYARLKEIGINHVHSYGAANPDHETRILDVAGRHGLKVMYDLAAKSRLVGDDPDAGWTAVTGLVDRIKDHPALGLWYLWDEPYPAQMPLVRKLDDHIRSVSDKPTILVIHWRETWYDTRGYSDWWMVDQYPVRGEPFPDAPLHNYTRFLSLARLANLPGTPLMTVMQACDFRCFASMAPEEHRKTLRFPNTEEMRFMAFSSFVHGVRGFYFFSQYHCHQNTPEGKAYFDDVFTPGLAEWRAFADAVERPWDVTAMGLDLNWNQKVNLAYWKRPAGDFMVMTNNTPETRDISFALAGRGFPEGAKLTPWGPTPEGEYTLADSRLTAKAVPPWGTCVWRLEPLP